MEPIRESRPQSLNKVLNSINCTACGLTKRNRQPIFHGSGIHTSPPKEHLNVDYQGGVHLISVHNFSSLTLQGLRLQLPTVSSFSRTPLATLSTPSSSPTNPGPFLFEPPKRSSSCIGSTDITPTTSDATKIPPRHQDPVGRTAQDLVEGVSCPLPD